MAEFVSAKKKKMSPAQVSFCFKYMQMFGFILH